MQNLKRERELHYRRGLVLGLSLAELLLLIVFILLVLIAIGFARQDASARALSERPAITLSQYEALQDQVAFVSLVKHALGLAPDEPLPDDFVEAAVAMAQRTDVAAAKERQERIDALVKALEDAGVKDPDKLISDLANAKGRVEQLQKQLRTAGAGRVFPSCWATPEGDIVYLLDVALTSSGILVEEPAYGARQPDRERLPMARFTPTEHLQPRDFLGRTKAVFDQSVAENCRFYVTVRDQTAAEEKQLYKDLLSAVEGHFYKRAR